MKKYSKAYTCQQCGKVFPKVYKLMKHERGCEARVKYVYPGGVYTPPKNIFDRMEEEGIQVPEDLKFSKYFATFDIEVFYPKSSQLPPNKPKLEFTAEHRLLSVRVSSNVSNYQDAKCLIVKGNHDEQAQQLVHDLVAYLDEMSDAAYELEQVRYQELKKVILETIKPDPTHPSQQALGCDQEEDVGYDDDRASEEEEEEEDRAFINDDDDVEEDVSFYTTQTKRSTLAQTLVKELDEHLHSLPVIGVHSGTYDLNVLKRFIVPYLTRRRRSIHH